MGHPAAQRAHPDRAEIAAVAVGPIQGGPGSECIAILATGVDADHTPPPRLVAKTALTDALAASVAA